MGVACVLGALVASCATGVGIDEDVLVVPRSPGVQSDGDPDAREGASDGAEPSTNDGEAAAGAELSPPSGEMSEGGPDEDLARGDQPVGNEPSSSPPADEEPRGDDSEQVPPEDVPIVDTEPEPGLDPITQPDPEGDADPSDPADPPGATDPELDPPTLDPGEVPAPVLPAPAHCLAGWEGSSCDACSGQTQSDRSACRLYIDCYLESDCEPASCGSLDQACSVNRLGNGLAPKDIADAVYSCMCAP